jgi:hypothetical protein
MKQDNVSAGQTRELDNPQLICECHSTNVCWQLAVDHELSCCMTCGSFAAMVDATAGLFSPHYSPAD